jgi:hypothetical protein
MSQHTVKKVNRATDAIFSEGHRGGLKADFLIDDVLVTVTAKCVCTSTKDNPSPVRTGRPITWRLCFSNKEITKHPDYKYIRLLVAQEWKLYAVTWYAKKARGSDAVQS